ncbi:mitochondrial ribosomal protein L37-domain-containing protein [Mycena maculata]|uniref:Large ribosomal subunit protein mL54 n=1 Tax=Mycena maculata TaxID=230809 RepID=A0AAD7NBX5_9AGAR|nr:mitochondrial ribosomal protein L37-domain-containing protein [Mycena maculata]
MSLFAFSSIVRGSSCVAHLASRTRRAYASKPAEKSPLKGPPGKAPPPSSCVPDTVITGVNYLKGQPPVLALPDEEYPEWLWQVLKPRVWPEDGPGGRGERAARRAENKRKIRDTNFMKTQ